MFALNDCGDELDHINSIQMLYKYTRRLHRCYHNYYYTKQGGVLFGQTCELFSCHNHN